MLGKKQISNSDDWAKTWENISNIITYEHITKLTLKTLDKLYRVMCKYKNVAYCWSGGKDSLIIQKLIELSKIDIPSLLVLYPTEYPEMKKWLLEHKPKKCVVIKTSKISYEQINNDSDYLFPNKEKYIASYLPPRWKVQKEFRKSNDFDLLIMGRRTIDGNNCGSKENDYITKSQVGDSFNLIAEWTHEEVLAFIYYNKIELPPCYFYPRSWRYGTHCWTERGRLPNFPNDNFDEIMDIDKNILFQSRDKIYLVEKYLSERGL